MSLQTVAKKLGGVPTGGTTGQTLVKNSATNYDVGWGAGGGGASFPLYAPDGSATTPQYSFGADAGKGLYSHATSVLGFALASTRRMTLEAGPNGGGILTLGPTGGTYLRSMANSVAGISLESSGGYMFASGRLAGGINGNAFYDGTAWNMYDTAVGASHISAGQGGINMYTSPAGASPSWNNYLEMQNSGLISLAGGLRVSGTVQPSAGVGIEIFMAGTTLGHLHGYNRGTASYIEMQVTGSIIRLSPSNRILYGNGLAYYDPGWPHGFKGNMITDGRLYQRGNGGYYCLDAGDMSAGVVGSAVVQRTVEGYINCNYLNITADVQGGAPVYVLGQNGDGYTRWYPKAQFSASTQSNSNWNPATNVGGYYQALSLTAFKTGHAQVSIVGFMGTGGGDVSGICQIRINGGVGIESSYSRSSAYGAVVHVAATWTGAVNNGDAITGWFGSNNGGAHYNNGGGITVTIG